MKKIGTLIIFLMAFGFANAESNQFRTTTSDFLTKEVVVYHGQLKHAKKRVIRRAERRKIRRLAVRHKVRRHLRNQH